MLCYSKSATKHNIRRYQKGTTLAYENKANDEKHKAKEHFLILQVFCSFCFIGIACGSVFGRTSNANAIFGHPTPQGTHSKIIVESQP